MKTLKQKVLSGETTYGCWLNLGSHVSAEIVSTTGFDWLLIDMEHGAGNEMLLYHQLQVLQHGRAAAIVRIADITRPAIQRIMDAGADGIMFPQIRSEEEAQLAVSSMYYPPLGIRGLAKMVRATGFGNNFDEYRAGQEDRLLGIVQIETLEALKNVDLIAAIPQVDVLFVGPSDLSMSLGIFGQFEHPDYRGAIEKIAQAAMEHGKASGILLPDINHYKIYYDLGFRFIASGADTMFVLKGAIQTLQELKKQG